MGIAALEARARGTHEVLSPVLDLARDPRWGRTEETYGEDPYLVSRLGVAAIRGYQGTSRTLAKDKVLATAKHFAGRLVAGGHADATYVFTLPQGVHQPVQIYVSYSAGATIAHFRGVIA